MNTILKNICLASLVLWSAQPVQATDAKWWATRLGTVSASALLTKQIAAKHVGVKENARGIALGVAGAALATVVVESCFALNVKKKEIDFNTADRELQNKFHGERCTLQNYKNLCSMAASADEAAESEDREPGCFRAPSLSVRLQGLREAKHQYPKMLQTAAGNWMKEETMAEDLGRDIQARNRKSCKHDHAKTYQAKWRTYYRPYISLFVPAIFYATTLSKTKLVPVS